MPKSPLGRTTTITISKYVTSIVVGYPQTSTITVTLTPTDIVTDQIPMGNVNVTDGVSPGWTFQATPSIDLGPIIIRTSNPPPSPIFRYIQIESLSAG